MKIRQGNAFTVNWTIVVNKGQTPLSDLDLTVEVTNPIGQSFYPSFVVEDDHLSIPISTKMQKWTGLYHLTCWCNKGEDDQTVVDDINAFEIVDRAEENFEVVSVVEVGVSSLYYNLGGMSAYEIAVAHGFEGTEQDWLESLHQPAKDAAEDIAEMQEQADAALTDVIESREEISGIVDQANELIDKLEDINDTITRMDDFMETLDNVAYKDDIPDVSEFVTQSWVEQQGYKTTDTVYDDTDVKNRLTSLEGIDHSKYATTDWVAAQSYLTEHQSLDGYATQEWVNTTLNNLPEGGIQVEEDPVFAKWLSENEVAYVGDIPTDYAKLSDIPTDYAKLSDIPTDYAKLSDIPTSNTAFTNDAGYITLEEVPTLDLDDYYTKTEVDDLIENNGGGGIATETDPVFNGWKNGTSIVAGNNAVNGVTNFGILMTKNNVVVIGNGAKAQSDNCVAIGNNATAAAGILNGVAIGNGVTANATHITNVNNVLKGDSKNDAYIKDKEGNYTKILDLLNSGSSDVDLDNYYTKQEVDNKIPSLDGYATHEWVNTTLNNLPEGGIQVEEDPVFTKWLSENEVAVKSDIPNVSEFVTQSWVEQQGYKTTDTVYDDTDVKNRLTSLEGIDHSKYATTDWVAAQSYLTEHQSLAGYATEDWVRQQNYLTECTPYDDTNLQNRVSTLESIDHTIYTTKNEVNAMFIYDEGTKTLTINQL